MYHQGITIGNPEKISRGIGTYTDIGVTHFILHFIGLNESALRLFHSKVYHIDKWNIQLCEL